MKIVHTSHICLGKPGFESKSRDVFLKACLFAKEKGARAVLLSGDVFYSDSVDFDEVNYFVRTVSGFPGITFFAFIPDGIKDSNSWPKNFNIFDETFSKYSLGDVSFGGFTVTSDTSEMQYSLVNFSRSDFNVLMLGGSVPSLRSEPDSKIKNLRYHNIDYAALPGISTINKRLDFRGRCVSPGCPYQSSDENLNEYGCVLVDTETKLIEFVKPFDTQDEPNYEVKDIAPTDDAIEDVTLNDAVISNEVSLRSEFAKLVMNDDKMSENQKNDVLRVGLAALSGEDF